MSDIAITTRTWHPLLRLSVSAAARARAALLGLVVLAGGCGITADTSTDQAALSQTAAAARHSILLVVACTSAGASKHCRYATAWAVAPHLFVTAGHALSGLATVALSSRQHGTAPATVAGLDMAHDLAVLRSDLVLPPLVRTRNADDGTALVAVCSRRAVAYQGHPNQSGLYEGELDGGTIRATVSNQEVLLARVAGAASVLGCSGGPVLDAAGEVAGITVAGDGHSAGMVPVDVALRLVHQHV
jgi:hypothetical protein